MPRLVIFGDLHANWEAWLALWQAENNLDALFCLGDVVGYGPDPKRCLDVVRSSVSHAIRGQHDLAIGLGETRTENDLLSGTWTHAGSVLTASDRQYLATLPDELTVSWAGVRFHLARLNPDNMAAETYTLITAPASKLEERFAHIEADIILLGGTHIPAMRQVNGRLIICPGSLGLPRYGVPDPTFAVWQDGDVRISHLHYHPDQTIQKLSLIPLDPEHTLWLQYVLRTGDRSDR
jgi:predicted phosphodiesterase